MYAIYSTIPAQQSILQFPVFTYILIYKKLYTKYSLFTKADNIIYCNKLLATLCSRCIQNSVQMDIEEEF